MKRYSFRSGVTPSLLWTMTALFSLCLTLSCSPVHTIGERPSVSSVHVKSVHVKTNSLSSPLRMGCSYDWAGWWPWAVAQEQQFFEKNGANIELQWFDDYYAALDALAEGTLDANCQVLNDTVEMADRAVNGEVVVLVTDNSAGNDKIIADESIQSVDDLVGQRVGVEAGKLTDFLLDVALDEAEIEREVVDIRTMNTRAAAIAFLMGQLDAVVTWQPDWLTALRRSRSHELLSSKDFPGVIPQVIAVSRTALENHGDDIQGLVQTWFDTLQFIEEQPTVAEPIMLERSHLLATDYQRFMEGVRFFSEEENAMAFSPGDTWEHLDFTIQKAAEFLVDVGAIDEGPEVENMLSLGLPMRSMYRPLDGVLRDTGYAQVNLS